MQIWTQVVRGSNSNRKKQAYQPYHAPYYDKHRRGLRAGAIVRLHIIYDRDLLFSAVLSSKCTFVRGQAYIRARLLSVGQPSQRHDH